MRKYFFEGKWYEVYDFVEFVANNYSRYGFKDAFTRACYFQGKDLLRIGFYLSVIEAIILLLLVPFYWPLIGIR